MSERNLVLNIGKSRKRGNDFKAETSPRTPLEACNQLNRVN